MAALRELTSIFQLAFGLDAALPAVYVSFRSAHETVTKSVAALLENHDPALKFTDRMNFELQNYLLSATRGLRIAKAVTHASAIFLLIGLALSFLGLVEAAVAARDHIAGDRKW